MKVLLIGSGGREHALCRKLAASDLVETVYVAPGNGGTALEPAAVNVDLGKWAIRNELDSQVDPAVDFARAHGIELAVIGPEAPLVDGLADRLRAAGIASFGPGAAGARLEGSKQFSKDFMARNAIPTADYRVFTVDTQAEAYAYLDEIGAPVVIKADGLAAGKGVTVAATVEAARAALAECFDGRFGSAGDTVVIEECLVGPECSMIAFVDGPTVLCLAPSQDHKRVGEGDTGPNTGGMGVYSPVPLVTEQQLASMQEIMQQVAAALVAEGIEYRGVLYGGFMLTSAGPKVLEFNVRFGDPETQVILPRLESDLAQLLLATATGQLAGVSLENRDAVAVSVVLASAGYPGDYEKGKVITGIEAAEAIDGVEVYHAGTALVTEGVGHEQLVTAGGRVLNVTAMAADFLDAIQAAYAAVDRIHFDGAFCRRDIAQRAVS